MANIKTDTSHSGFSKTAFMIEAMVLLVVLIACMAVFVQLFTRSLSTANSSSELTQAIVIAQNAAEEFSADPGAVKDGADVGKGVTANGSDGFNVTCKVTDTATDTGTLYTAHITVSNDDGEIYSLTSTRYVSEVS